MSDSIRIECTHCGAGLKLKGADPVGKRIRCPKCRKAFVVEASGDEVTDDWESSDPNDDFLDGLNAVGQYEDAAPPAPRAPQASSSSKRARSSENIENLQDGHDEAPRRKRRKRSSDLSLGPIGWLVGGGIGGLIGGAVWVGVGHFTGFEVGWIAWGVGFIVGLGVYLGAGDNPSTASGGVAVAIALVSILAAKFVVAYLGLQQFQARLGDNRGQGDFLMAMTARQVAEEYKEQGRELKWPRYGVGKFREQVDPDEAFEKEDFPEDVWNEAKARLEQMPEKEREAMKEILGELGRNAIQQAGAGGVFEVFVSGLFRPSNFLWFFLAGITAFRLGAGLQSDN